MQEAKHFGNLARFDIQRVRIKQGGLLNLLPVILREEVQTINLGVPLGEAKIMANFYNLVSKDPDSWPYEPVPAPLKR